MNEEVMKPADDGGSTDALGPIEIAGWRIDLTTGEMERQGRLIRLAPKVAKTLEVLTLDPGRVISKDELMAAIWPDTIVGDDALWRCISELRTAFDENGQETSVIETLPRRGYRLRAAVSEAAPRPQADAETETFQPASRNSLATAQRRPWQRLRWILAISAAATVVVGIWEVGKVNKNRRITSSLSTQESTRSNSARFEPQASANAREWLRQLKEAEAVVARGGLARIEEGFTAVGLDALIRSARSPQLVVALERTAMAMHARGRLATALSGYDLVLEEDADRTRATRYRLSARAALAAIAARLETQRAAIVADPENPDLWVALGKSHRLLEERDPAWRNLAEALRLDPGHIEATVETARVHLTQGSLDEARRVVQRALRQHPENPSMLLLSAEIGLLASHARQIDSLDEACLGIVASGETAASSPLPLLCWAG